MILEKSKGAFTCFLMICAAFVLATCANAIPAQTPELMIKDAWANPPLVPQNNTAVYMTIENTTSTPRSIVSVRTKDAAGAQLHETQMDGKLMKMVPIKSLAVPAKGSVELKQGGYHIMCTGVKKALKAGDKINLVLKLDDGKPIPVTVTVRPAGDPPASAAANGQGMPMPGNH